MQSPQSRHEPPSAVQEQSPSAFEAKQSPGAIELKPSPSAVSPPSASSSSSPPMNSVSPNLAYSVLPPFDSDAKKTLLSTSSPEAIKVAQKITSARLANLLIRKGPLPIRHITSQLATEVPGFEFLSLSKQRRLIMAAMDQGDSENNVVFEKIGWGQWAVRKIDSDYIVTEGTQSNVDDMAVEEPAKINVHDLRNQAGLKLGWTKKQGQAGKPKAKGKSRRESITNNKSNLHNMKVPNEHLDSTLESDSEDDFALEDDEEEEEDEDDSQSDDIEEEEDALFAFDQDEKPRNTPIKFANRVPLKISPPPQGTSSSRRKSSSSVTKNAHNNTTRHQIFNRSRLNSIENLDNYIISSAKNSNLSINSPPLSTSHAGLSVNENSWNSNYIHNNSNPNISPDSIAATISTANRRKSSFNESHIRSTLSSSLPKPHLILSSPKATLLVSSPKPQLLVPSPPTQLAKPYENSAFSASASSIGRKSRRQPPLTHTINNQSDTDEEDWATIGAESLRENGKATKNDKDARTAAAFALVDLMSV